MDWITTSGRSLEEAKSYALDQLGIVADDAEFDIVNDVEKGLFGRVKTEAKVRARVRPRTPAAKDDRRRNNSRNRGGKGGGKQRGGSSGDNRGNKGGSSKGGQPKSGNRDGNKNAQQQGNRSGGGRGKGGNDNRNGGQDKNKQVAKTAAGAAVAQNVNQDKAAEAAPKKGKSVEMFSRDGQEQAAIGFLNGVLDVFDMDADVVLQTELAEDNAIELAVNGEGLGLLVGQKGVTLNALQELTRTVVQREADGAKTDRLRVDVAGYRERRTAALQKFSTEIAGDVLESGSEKLLEPMGPADRKIVHDTINDIDGVVTGSEGEEPRRRVVIRPA